MEYAIYAAVYIGAGCLVNFMDGYARPNVQNNSHVWANWLVVMTWPYRIAGTCGAFGAALRVGWGK